MSVKQLGLFIPSHGLPNLNPWFRLQLKAEFLFLSSLNSSLTLALALLCEFDKHPHQRQHL